MNVSFDGLRRNTTSSMNMLSRVLDKVIKDYKDDFYHGEEKEIIEAFNRAAMFVDTFNCLFDDSVDGDMNDLSDLCVDRLDDLEEED